MEKEGLKRALDNLEKHGMKVDMLVTDRHAEIKAFMRTSYPQAKHRFDVWHVAKGMHINYIAFLRDITMYAGCTPRYSEED